VYHKPRKVLTPVTFRGFTLKIRIVENNEKDRFVILSLFDERHTWGTLQNLKKRYTGVRNETKNPLHFHKNLENMYKVLALSEGYQINRYNAICKFLCEALMLI